MPARQRIGGPDRPEGVGAGQGRGLVERVRQRRLATLQPGIVREKEIGQQDIRRPRPIEVPIAFADEFGPGNEEQGGAAPGQGRHDEEVGGVAAQHHRLAARDPPAGTLTRRDRADRITRSGPPFAMRQSGMHGAGRDPRQPIGLLPGGARHGEQARDDHGGPIGFERHRATHQLRRHRDIGESGGDTAMRLRQAERKKTERGISRPGVRRFATRRVMRSAPLFEAVDPAQHGFDRCAKQGAHLVDLVGNAHARAPRPSDLAMMLRWISFDPP